MIVCIAGMHRSATSMITRMLVICGLYVGEANDLYPAQPDNPEGFWEHFEFHAINERILDVFHGAWDAPKKLPEDWLKHPRLESIRTDARALIDRFKDHEHWGWKDPRNSLTLPFWQDLIPNLLTVVPVRHPLDVADSLVRRGYSSQAAGLTLWQAYSDSLDTFYDPEKMIFTHQTIYFQDAGPELDRVLNFCKLQPSHEQRDEALSTISAKLRHSNSSLIDLFQPAVPPQITRQYFVDCLRCGPNFEPTLLKQIEDTSNLEVKVHEQAANAKRDLVQEKLRTINKDLEIARLCEQQETIHKAYVENTEATHASYRKHIEDAHTAAEKRLRESLQAYEEALKEAQSEVHTAKANEQQTLRELEILKGSVSWKLGRGIVRLLSAPRRLFKK